MTARADFVIASAENVLMVPLNAYMLKANVALLKCITQKPKKAAMLMKLA